MKFFLKVLFILPLLQCSQPPKNQGQIEAKSDSIEVVFNYDQSPVDFTVSNTSGFELTFHKNKDSTAYNYFRFRVPESEESLLETLPVLAGLWDEAQNKIDIQLSAINVGYPLEYNDVLTRLIQTFAGSDSWRNRSITSNDKIDYKLVERIMSESNIYPLDELLFDFGYEFKGISVEKVGLVEPERLVGLGFDESLSIPMPYMVWIEVEEKK